jgi:16S rRNA processing protein RimM
VSTEPDASTAVQPTADLLEIGRTGRAHGVRGDLSLILVSDRVERLAAGKRLQVGERSFTITASRPAGTRWLVHFEGVDDRNAAELLANQPVLGEPLPSNPDDLYVHDLIGADVVDMAGTSYGKCTAVLANPAHDILELESGALVPVVFVMSATPGRIVIDPPEGLFDLE